MPALELLQSEPPFLPSSFLSLLSSLLFLPHLRCLPFPPLSFLRYILLLCVSSAVATIEERTGEPGGGSMTSTALCSFCRVLESAGPATRPLSPSLTCSLPLLYYPSSPLLVPSPPSPILSLTCSLSSFTHPLPYLFPPSTLLHLFLHPLRAAIVTVPPSPSPSPY